MVLQCRIVDLTLTDCLPLSPVYSPHPWTPHFDLHRLQTPNVLFCFVLYLFIISLDNVNMLWICVLSQNCELKRRKAKTEIKLTRRIWYNCETLVLIIETLHIFNQIECFLANFSLSLSIFIQNAEETFVHSRYCAVAGGLYHSSYHINMAGFRRMGSQKFSHH